jgi:hypothetical protein
MENKREKEIKEEKEEEGMQKKETICKERKKRNKI